VSLLEQASKLGGVQMNTGTYISISGEALQTFLAFLHTAEERILAERLARRAKVQEIATMLVLAGKLDSSTASRINDAFKKTTETEKFNKLINAPDDDYMKVSPSFFMGSVNSSVKAGYQRMHVLSGGHKTQDLGDFLIKHGVYGYSKKLKSINDLISATNRAIAFKATINLDLPTLTNVEFINSTAFERYNETYLDLISQAMEAASNVETIQESSGKSS